MQSWDDMRFFLAVARTGGLSAAAKQIGVEPSTVHRRVGLLEEALDTRLFDRHPRGYTLTEAGAELVGSAERVEAELFACQRRMLGRDRSLSGRVRLATAEDVASFLLQPVLVEFHQEHPRIELDVRVGNQALSLSRREADIAVRVGGPQKDPNVVAKRVCGVGVALYASRGYLSERGRPRRMSDVGRHAILTADESMPALRQAMTGLAPDAVEVYRSNSVAHLAFAAASGLGITALPCFAAEAFPELVRLFRKPISIPASFWVLVHHEVRRAARVRALAEHLRGALTGRRAHLEGRGA